MSTGKKELEKQGYVLERYGTKRPAGSGRRTQPTAKRGLDQVTKEQCEELCTLVLSHEDDVIKRFILTGIMPF